MTGNIGSWLVIEIGSWLIVETGSWLVVDTGSWLVIGIRYEDLSGESKINAGHCNSASCLVYPPVPSMSPLVYGVMPQLGSTLEVLTQRPVFILISLFLIIFIILLIIFFIENSWI